MRLCTCVFWLVLLGSALSFAAGAVAVEPSGGLDPNDSLEDLLTVHQEDLLGMDTAITSLQAASLREAPGVLTVISRDEIMATGARDLADVLHVVAGFAFAADVESVTDVGFRGIWGHEGKILLLIDGQEFNEPLYSTLQLGNHFLLHNVDRIEIIRGPGSVIYGGNAELSVINVISRNAAQIGKLSAQLDYGEFTGAYAQRSVQGAFGHVFETLDLQVSGDVAWGQGNRSDGLFRDFNSSPTYRGTQGNARVDPLLLKLNVTWGALTARFIFDQYHLTDRYPYDTLLSEPLPLDFITWQADLQYTGKPVARLTIVPRLTYKRQEPWRSIRPTVDNYETDYYDKYVDRTTASIVATWNPSDDHALLLGVALMADAAGETLPPLNYQVSTQTPFANGRLTIMYLDFATFAQWVWNNPWFNLTLGGRYEKHNAYPSSFVPRAVITKVVGDFHFKILASQAFRAPAIENIHSQPDIHSERTLALEIEAGYSITKAFYIGINLYDMTLTDPIVYISSGSQDGYFNFNRTGSRGLEFEGRYRGSWGFASVNYTLASTAGKNDVTAYAVPGNSSVLLGLPMHKLAFTAGVPLGDHILVGPTVIVLSPRYGTLNTPGMILPTAVTCLANLYLTYKNLGMEGLDLSVGGYNLLGEPFTFIQAYNTYAADVSNGRAPTPGLNREFSLRLTWSWR